MSTVILAVFQYQQPHTFIMLPITSLQRTTAKAMSTKLRLSFLENKGCNKDRLKNLLLDFLPSLHRYRFFKWLSVFLTIRTSLAQYGKQMKINYAFTYANRNINLIFGFGKHAQPLVEYITYLMFFYSYIFSFVLSFHTLVNPFLKFLTKCLIHFK